MTKLLTTEHLLEKLHICRKTLDNHISKGILPAPIRIGRRRYWPQSAIEAVITAKTPVLVTTRGGRYA